MAYNLKVPAWHHLSVGFSVISILGALIASKYWSGAAIFGESLEMIAVNSGTYTAILLGMGIVGFVLMCAFDFERRRLANIILDQMFTGGARKVIRSFGERYLFRDQSYTSILLCFSFLCVAFKKLLAWTQDVIIFLRSLFWAQRS